MFALFYNLKDKGIGDISGNKLTLDSNEIAVLVRNGVWYPPEYDGKRYNPTKGLSQRDIARLKNLANELF